MTGSDYPEEFAHISFLPLAQLRLLTEGLTLILINSLLIWRVELAARACGRQGKPVVAC